MRQETNDSLPTDHVQMLCFVLLCLHVLTFPCRAFMRIVFSLFRTLFPEKVQAEAQAQAARAAQTAAEAAAQQHQQYQQQHQQGSQGPRAMVPHAMASPPPPVAVDPREELHRLLMANR